MTTNPPAIDEVCALITTSVTDVLVTAFNLGALPADSAPRSAGEPHVVASVGFIGEANGMVHLRVSALFARTLASSMLGLTDAEIEGDEMVNDVIGEFGNMVVGAVKSRLCDAGHPCVLTIPTVMRGAGLQIDATGGAERRELHFRCGEELLVVELLMKSGR